MVLAACLIAAIMVIICAVFIIAVVGEVMAYIRKKKGNIEYRPRDTFID